MRVFGSVLIPAHYGSPARAAQRQLNRLAMSFLTHATFCIMLLLAMYASLWGNQR